MVKELLKDVQNVRSQQKIIRIYNRFYVSCVKTMTPIVIGFRG